MSTLPASAPELGKGPRKSLASAGHLVERFGAACDLLRAHVKDGRVELPSPWREAVIRMEPCGLAGDGCFVLELVLTELGKGKLHPRPLMGDEAAEAIAAWKVSQPEVAAGETTLLPVPSALHAPLWRALLRLRQLREFWERELRRNGLEQLLALLPDAWLGDPTPLPPGAVVPRLEIGSWDELDQLAATGRKFEKTEVDHTTFVLSERETEGESANVVRAIYEKKGARVEMVGVV